MKQRKKQSRILSRKKIKWFKGEVKLETTIMSVASYTFQAFYWLMIAYILMSWIPSLRNSSFGGLIAKVVEPYLSIFRKVIPPIGGLDLSPILAFFAYRFLSSMALVGIQTFIDIVQKYI